MVLLLRRKGTTYTYVYHECYPENDTSLHVYKKNKHNLTYKYIHIQLPKGYRYSLPFIYTRKYLSC
jgi:hypothetical protein